MGIELEQGMEMEMGIRSNCADER